MTAPAAMSQQWIPIWKKASTAATRHMLVAAVPEPRSLSGQAKPTRRSVIRHAGGRSAWRGLSPVHRDAQDLLHGAENLADHFLAPVGSVLRDDNGLPDFCNESARGDYNQAPTCLITDSSSNTNARH